MQEFQKAIHDFQIQIDPKDVSTLFRIFDVNNDGQIDFDEFLRYVVGPMNQFRTNLVLRAFDKMDKDGNGVLEVSDIKGTYNARNHPDVRSGKKTEDEVLMEFLETFEMHYNVKKGYQADGRVTKEEFIEYYNNISCSIDND